MDDPQATLGAKLKAQWAVLEDPPVLGDTLRTVDLPVTTPNGPVLLGRAADGRRILVPLAPDGQRAFKQDRRGSALRLLLRAVETDEVVQWHADLACLRPEAAEVFAAFTVDVLARIEADPDHAIRALRRAMSDWRALFASGERLLGVAQLTGLFGELSVLERLLQTAAAAVGLWRGPLREPHDFSNGKHAVEVKTTLVDAGMRFVVHGLEQLAEPPGGRLALANIRLQQTLEGGQSVPDLLARCEGLAGVNLGPLVEPTGYHKEHEEAYRRISFEIHDEVWYEIDDRFPRITAASFTDGRPNGVTQVLYELDLHGLEPRTLDARQVDAHLNAMIEEP